MNDDQPDAERPSDQHHSIIDEVARLTGEEPAKVMLRDVGSAQGEESPILDPNSPEKKLLPKGRGNHQVMGEIARGGMGLILKCHDHDLGRDVALKVLAPELSENPAVVQRFVEEAQVAGQLQHPGIVPVYELGLMADDRPYFTMKLIKGRTLAALLSARKTLDDDRQRILAIFESICLTVAYAHSKGVIHRDLKPANVMVGAFGEVQVVDWGLAKVLRGGGVDDEVRAKISNLTLIETVRSGPGSGGSESMVGSVMGTPAYMPPEQACGEIAKLDERADVFSLGAILCEILTGAPPYRGEDEDGDRTVVQAAQGRIDPARERVEACQADEELKRLCLACLTPSRAARPSNAAEVADKVHEYLASLEERTRKAQVAAAEAAVKAAAERRARNLTMALAATVVIAVGAVGGTLWVQDRSQKERQANAERAVDEAQTRILALQGSGRFDDALAAARNAGSLVATAAADDTLRGRVQRLEEQASALVEAEEQRLLTERKNRRLLDRLEVLRLQNVEIVEEELDAGYVEAFGEYGIDLEHGELGEILDQLRESGMAEEVALGLDDWSSVRQDLYDVGTYERDAPTALAFDLDPDPLRTQIRQAILSGESQLLLDLLDSGEADTLPAATLWVLCTALASLDHEFVAAQTVRKGVQRYPDDFRLNVMAGINRANDEDTVQSLRYLSTARGLRPEDAYVHSLLGNLHWQRKDFLDSVLAYEEAQRLDPEWIPDSLLGWSYFFLGETEKTLRVFERRAEARPTIWVRRHDLLCLRFYHGRAEREEMLAWLATKREPSDHDYRAASLVLGGHPDPEARDAEKAVELMELVVARAPIQLNLSLLSQAQLQAGRWSEALDTLDREAQLLSAQGPSEKANLDYKRAVAHARLDQRDAAGKAFERAERSIEHLVFHQPERWTRSMLYQWYAEAKTLLGR